MDYSYRKYTIRINGKDVHFYIGNHIVYKGTFKDGETESEAVNRLFRKYSREDFHNWFKLDNLLNSCLKLPKIKFRDESSWLAYTEDSRPYNAFKFIISEIEKYERKKAEYDNLFADLMINNI